MPYAVFAGLGARQTNRLYVLRMIVKLAYWTREWDWERTHQSHYNPFMCWSSLDILNHHPHRHFFLVVRLSQGYLGLIRRKFFVVYFIIKIWYRVWIKIAESVFSCCLCSISFKTRSFLPDTSDFRHLILIGNRLHFKTNLSNLYTMFIKRILLPSKKPKMFFSVRVGKLLSEFSVGYLQRSCSTLIKQSQIGV